MRATFHCLHLRLVFSSFLFTTLETSILPSFPSFDLLMLLRFTDLIATFFEYSFCTDPSRVQLRTRSRFPTPNGHSIWFRSFYALLCCWVLILEAGDSINRVVDNVNTIIAPTLVGEALICRIGCLEQPVLTCKAGWGFP
ncbi:hypothetical protein JHK87_025757 [Glycine soja]|nr:hypothetical protein JHK87_025757 [Glycine soja]